MSIDLEIIGTVVIPVKEPVDENWEGIFLIDDFRLTISDLGNYYNFELVAF